jgi:hypothetical protein
MRILAAALSLIVLVVVAGIVNSWLAVEFARKPVI